jgi:hypothetical protein
VVPGVKLPIKTVEECGKVLFSESVVESLTETTSLVTEKFVKEIDAKISG